jgi:hypothetical protein
VVRADLHAIHAGIDALPMLIQYCNQRKINLGQALFDKMQINLNREWLPPDEDGIVFHKKEAE